MAKWRKRVAQMNAGEKACNRCCKTKALEEFSARVVNGITYYRSRCSPCEAQWMREQRAAHPEKTRAQNGTPSKKRSNRNWMLKARYGIALTEFEAMLAAQNDLCAICEQPESGLNRLGEPARLSVDHDHATGAVRGLLCARCNRAVGLLLDDPERCRKAAAYLTKPRLRLVPKAA